MNLHLYLSEVHNVLSHAHKSGKINAFYTYTSYSVTAPNFNPSGLTLVSTSPTSITITWTVPSTSPDADGYVLYYASGSGPDMSVKIVGGSVSEHTIEGLTPDTTYTISIRAYQDILGPASETVIVMTNATEGTHCPKCEKIFIRRLILILTCGLLH